MTDIMVWNLLCLDDASFVIFADTLPLSVFPATMARGAEQWPLAHAGSDSQLRTLIRAVIDAHPSDEQHFVEWKATLSLGKTGKEHNNERGYEIGMLR
ncbi:hypothetical protein [Cryobacterium sp. M15]|jgi:hypothetical protein|uniref:hypothetical protein n=1 Tax=Cryobacterium sp. M15 TaxID=2048291 RepID=UPI000CE44AC6|nr:hypothetical protein [Cryobacterium sp. M15]